MKLTSQIIDALGADLAAQVATERERCAKIAERIGAVETKASDEYERGFEDAAMYIALAIRQNK